MPRTHKCKSLSILISLDLTYPESVSNVLSDFTEHNGLNVSLVLISYEKSAPLHSGSEIHAVVWSSGDEGFLEDCVSSFEEYPIFTALQELKPTGMARRCESSSGLGTSAPAKSALLQCGAPRYFFRCKILPTIANGAASPFPYRYSLYRLGVHIEG